MAKARATGQDRSALAAADDVRRILGTLDEAKLLNIMALRPTILDVEEASVWLAAPAPPLHRRSESRQSRRPRA